MGWGEEGKMGVVGLGSEMKRGDFVLVEFPVKSLELGNTY